MERVLSDDALDILFRQARTHGDWTDEGIDEFHLRAIWDLA